MLYCSDTSQGIEIQNTLLPASWINQKQNKNTTNITKKDTIFRINMLGKQKKMQSLEGKMTETSKD